MEKMGKMGKMDKMGKRGEKKGKLRKWRKNCKTCKAKTQQQLERRRREGCCSLEPRLSTIPCRQISLN